MFNVNDAGDIVSLVEQAVVVVVAAIGKRHDIGNKVVVGEDEFHWSSLADSRPRPSPDVSAENRGAHLFAEVAVLVAAQVDGAIGSAHLAVDGLVPAEAG